MPLLTNLSHYSSTASYEAPPPCFGIDVSTIEGEHGKGNMTAEPTVLDLRANMQPHLASELVFDANLYDREKWLSSHLLTSRLQGTSCPRLMLQAPPLR